MRESKTTAVATVGVIGGSGMYELAPVLERVGPLSVCDVDGTTVAFLNRHGDGHRLPPHAVDYRANVRAFADAGVERILATFACGSLDPALGPGQLVVPDQLIDRTSGRVDTFHDDFTDGPAHAPFADPYDADLRRTLLDAAGDAALDGATVVVIDGPRFATRAESRWYRSMGASLINMTQYPESVLARELGIAYAAIGLVTDFDTGLDDDPSIEPVTQEEVFATFERHLPRLRDVVLSAVRCTTGLPPSPAWPRPRVR